MASREDVVAASGVAPGAVCPFLFSVRLIIDVWVTSMSRVNCESGDHITSQTYVCSVIRHFQR